MKYSDLFEKGGLKYSLALFQKWSQFQYKILIHGSEITSMHKHDYTIFLSVSALGISDVFLYISQYIQKTHISHLSPGY